MDTDNEVELPENQRQCKNMMLLSRLDLVQVASQMTQIDLNEGLESRHTSEEQTLEEICAQGFYLLIVNVLLKS